LFLPNGSIIKHGADRSLENFKEIFVAIGFTQKDGIKYEETLSLVATYTPIRTIIALAPFLGWKLHQMDVKTTFLNGKIEQEVFVKQPDGFVLHNKCTHVCKLKKALYGLKQAPRVWYDRIDVFLKILGFQKSDVDANLYFKVRGNHPVIIILYVDYLFLTGDEGLIDWCKREITLEFEMKDLGLMHYFLGLEIWKRQGKIFMAQGKYIVDVLKRFGMMDFIHMSTPMITNLRKLHDSDTISDLVDPTMYRQLIGSMMYMIHTRPDICYEVIGMSHFMTEARKIHWVEVNHILRYLIGTITNGMRYTSNGGLFLHGYKDVDWAGILVDRKSAFRYFFSLGSTMISWSRWKHVSIAQTKIEAEHITTSDASKEAIWLKNLVSGLFGDKIETTMVHCDNQSYIKLTEKSIFHDR
jgi:hypothetical protein